MNLFCLGTGYLRVFRKYRFFALALFFLVICYSFIFGIPDDAYAHIPYYMVALYIMALLIDAAVLSLTAKNDNLILHWSPRIATIAFMLFTAQSMAYLWLNAREHVTTQVIIVSTPDMLPQLHVDDLIVTKAWVWRPRILGEKGLQRGDIVTYQEDGTRMILRRIVALPGETMALHNGIARINGTPFAVNPSSASATPLEGEQAVQETLRTETTPNGRSYQIITKRNLPDQTGIADTTFTIPEGYVGVLADNRPEKLSEDLKNSLVIPLNIIQARPIRIISAKDPSRTKKMVQ